MTLHSISSASAELVCVDPARISEIWPHVCEFIREALRRGDMGTFAALQGDVLTGRALLWIAWRSPTIEAAAVTQITLTERSKVCAIRACGGRQFRKWLWMLGPIEKYAKEQGCNVTRIVGRKGWARVLPEYKTAKVVLERQL